jgi:asparagine synthase (glutamine-hydrolysing)
VIAAILRVDGSALDSVLPARTVSTGLPFAPDLKGAWADGPVGVADARLDLTENSGPSLLPARDDQRGLVLAWDGRLDNRDDLVASLGGRPTESPIDEILVFEAYAKWGVMFIEHILGDFAFVLWDGRARRLLAARDRMGVRPLHYAFDGRSLVITSRIGQILDGAGFARHLNEPMIANYLSFNASRSPETLFRGILRVPAAHILQHDQGAQAPRVWRYWSANVNPPIRYSNDGDYAEHFRAITETAVQSRLRTAYPVGVMLSGGLDSSSVACLASRLKAGTGSNHGRLTTFTTVFDHPRDGDERQYVEPLVAHLGLDSYLVSSDGMWTLHEGAPPIGSWDEPFEGMYDGVVEGLLDRAQAEGVRVLLTGHGADMLFSGSRYYLHDVLLDLGLPASVRDMMRCPLSRWKSVLGSLILASLTASRPVHEASFKAPEWVRPDFALRMAREQSLRTGHPPQRFNRPSQQCDFEAISYVEFAQKMLWMQAEGIRRGIDLRHPFLDARLIDFCMRIPSWQKQRSGVTKVLVRSVMHESLPLVMAERPFSRTDFTMVLDRGLRERQRHQWEGCFTAGFRLAEMGYVDPVPLRDALARYVEGGEADLRSDLARVFRLERWLRHQTGESQLT